jgi:hypothetical protein
MRISHLAVVALLVLLAACDSSGGVHSAEVLSTPVSGVVLTATANHHKCSTDGCLFTYRLRLTNPMDLDVSVQDCRLASEPLRLPIMGQPGGAPMSANEVVTQRTTAQLPIKKAGVKRLRGADVTCTALDWHGDAPI